MDAILALLFRVITQGIFIYQILLIVYILMSWIPSSRESSFGRLLGKITEPYLGFFRKFIPPLGMIDISPIVAIYALNLINRGISQVFIMIAQAIS